MEFKINIDMEKIDYDSINKEVIKKIEELNISDIYPIKTMVKDTVLEEVEKATKCYIGNVYGIKDDNYYDLQSSARNNIKNMAESILRESLKERITSIISKIPEEELTEIIISSLPTIMISIMKDMMCDSIYTALNSAEPNINALIEKRIREMF